jgi:hypothetical protein
MTLTYFPSCILIDFMKPLHKNRWSPKILCILTFQEQLTNTCKCIDERFEKGQLMRAHFCQNSHVSQSQRPDPPPLHRARLTSIIKGPF